MAKKGQSKYMPHMRARLLGKRTVSTGFGRMAFHTSDVLAEHERMQEKAKTNANKGKRGGDCNRTQCQRPHAWWYNKTMRAYYCGNCAGAINESCLHKDHIASFGSMVYVKPPTVKMMPPGEFWQLYITTADGETTTQNFSTQEELNDAHHHFIAYSGLRLDGSAPFHYSELRDKMLRNRELIQQRYPDLEMVPFE